MPTTVTIHELQQTPIRILDGLAQGREFILIAGGTRVARLVPIPRSPDLQFRSDPPGTTLTHLEVLFGLTSLTRMLGLTEATYLDQRALHALSHLVQARLMAIQELIDLQQPVLSPGLLRRWWQRPHNALRGRSPIDHLAFPWEPGDPHVSQVTRLILHQSAAVQR